MTHSVPVYKSAPLEFRVALDIASSWLIGCREIRLVCEQPFLEEEAKQRLNFTTQAPWSGGLWIEPQQSSWKQSLLAEFTQQSSASYRLAIMLSLSTAHKLPECQDWAGTPLGEQSTGINRLVNELAENEFTTITAHGIHSSQAVLLNLAASIAQRLSRFALADRLEFLARKQYIKPYSTAWRSTCALLLAAKP